MKKMICLTLAVILSISILGCSTVQKVSETVKPKPTKEGAKTFELKWRSLWNTGKYAEQYSLIVPEQQKLIPKNSFIDACKADAAQANGIKPAVTVTSVDIKGDSASLVISINTPLGTYSDTDNIVFRNGEWRQLLEADALIRYGVSPNNIESIKKGELAKPITVPAYSVTINNPRSDKTATGQYGSRETAQGKFIMVDIAITNTGKQPFRPTPSEEFKLSDSEGRSFSPADKFMVFQPFGEIGPGMSGTQTVGFDVPDSANGFVLLIGRSQDMFSVALGF